jgi:hypothetical protein
MPKCIVCGKNDSYPNLVQINIRESGKGLGQGRVLEIKYVHGPCYEKDPQWVERQVKGINPKYYFNDRRNVI